MMANIKKIWVFIKKEISLPCTDSLFNYKRTMGKGDIKTKKGKINKGSYGKKRSRSNNKAVPAVEKK